MESVGSHDYFHPEGTSHLKRKKIEGKKEINNKYLYYLLLFKSLPKTDTQQESN